MKSTFDVDKGDLLRRVLDKLNVRFREKAGWQQVSCPNEKAHVHGDQNPSCAIHLGYGKIHCFACDLNGDAFDLVGEVLGLSPKEVLEWVEMEAGKVESEWLI